MITVRTNTAEIIGKLLGKVQSLNNTDKLLRTIATNARAEMKHRIHVDGLAKDGNPIGEYSPEYMKVRTGRFNNSTKISRGTKEGQNKDAGIYTRGEKKGTQRTRFNRTNDTRVVISLTRQMENDLVVVSTSKGYGLGYNNKENALKVGYVENTYNKKIFGFTQSEKESLRTTARAFVKQQLGNA